MAEPRVVVLVEGESDRAAVDTLAARTGLDPTGFEVRALGGATNVGHALRALRGVRVGGLYDEAEERFFARALGRQRGEPLEPQGFFKCVADLEDEFIRAIGVGGVIDLLRSERELDSFRVLQHQPAHRDAEIAGQLHRFLGTKSGRKARYGGLLAAAVPLDRVPRPITGLLDWVERTTAGQSG